MYYTDDTVIFLDGDYHKASDAKASLFSQSLHYGNSVFEGIRAYNTDAGPVVFKAKEHFKRLRYSAEKMHLPCDYTLKELTAIAYELLKRNRMKDAYIRPMIFAGENMSLAPAADSHLLMATWHWGRYLGDQLSRVMVSSYRRLSPDAFHVDAKIGGQYVNSIMATQEAKRKGFDEALLLDINGNIAEGSGQNFFCERSGVLYTPPAGHILPGITRATVIALCNELDIQVVEKQLTVEQVRKTDSAFFTGTAAEIAGINSLGDYTFPLAWEDSLGFLLSKKYRQVVTQSETPMPDSV